MPGHQSLNPNKPVLPASVPLTALRGPLSQPGRAMAGTGEPHFALPQPCGESGTDGD
jgi:hypothetical protein